MRSLLPSSLTGRLVATLVGVVLVTTVLITVVTALVTRGFLNDQLDGEVQKTLQRSEGRFGGGRVRRPAASGLGPRRRQRLASEVRPR